MEQYDELKKQAKDLIGKNKTEQAFELLGNEHFFSSDDELILLKRRYSSVIEDQRKGLVDNEVAERIHNQIIDDLLDFLNRKTEKKAIENTAHISHDISSTPTGKKRFNKMLFVIPVLIVAGIIYIVISNKMSISEVKPTISEIEDSLKEGGKVSTLLSQGVYISDFYGLSYQGGIIFYIDSIKQVGFVAAEKDQGSAGYGCFDLLCGSNERKIGSINTRKILDECKDENFAAKIAANYTGGDYDDWFLPSIFELEQMYSNIGPGASGSVKNIGNFHPKPYGSSTEEGDLASWHLQFDTGKSMTNSKNSHTKVRAIRKINNF